MLIVSVARLRDGRVEPVFAVTDQRLARALCTILVLALRQRMA